MGLVLKLTRAAVAEELRRDYVLFARSRGIPIARILAQVVRNALVPVITAIGIVFVYMLGGAILVETTFTLPGLGSLLVEAVTYKDIPVVQAVTLLLSTTAILVNLLVDLLYVVIDPRIRLGSGS